MSRKVERITLTCEQCGVVFDIPRYWAKGRRFCTAACQGRSKIAHMNAVRRSPKEYAKPPVMRGEANNKYVPAIEKTCIQCGEVFYRKPWQLNPGHGNIGAYCSVACRGAHRTLHLSGANSPHWVGGPCSYRGKNWRDARLAVVADQCGNCAKCGKHVGNSLPVHHIKPFREFASAVDANARANLVGLCQSCHMKSEQPNHLNHRRTK